MLPWEPLDAGGKRRVRAFGKRLKPGQLSSVGMPQSSKIYTFRQFVGRQRAYLLFFQPASRLHV